MPNHRVESIGEKRGEFATKIGSFVPLREDPPHLFEQGMIINGRYRVEEVLGEGGMGVVYRVLDRLHPKEPLALKTIRAAEGVPTNFYNLFKSEFRTMSELHHPNLAAVYDFDAMVGTADYFFTMELVRGVNILEATEGKEWKDVVDLLVPLCRALSYVHSRGIIHFDIKPGNLLVGDQGLLKVLDFGIASLKKMKGLKIIGGTIHYMAPELRMEGASIDHRADLYSLGILTYQLLCRSLPFDGMTLCQIVEQHQRGPIVWSEAATYDIPLWLRAIVERLCAKNPADRFRTANRVIEEINQKGGFHYELETQQTRESYIFSSRFVGRETEFAEISRFIDARIKQKGGESPVLFVSGQSGIGKSRLFRELKYRSQLSGIPFIEGNCYEGRFNEYGAIAELVGYLVPILEASGHSNLIREFGSELVKIEPRLAEQYEVEPSPELSKPEAEHLRLREQVSDFFVRVAEVIPYTLYINDLQWAPAGTSDLIYYLAWRIILRERLGDPCPIALLGSFRDDEVEGGPLEKFLARLRQENVFKVIELKPLSSASIEPMLCSMLGVDKLPHLFVERVIQETAGNPYFVEEVMRTLVENGSVFIENGEWAATTEIAQLEFPESISEVFLHRASLLSPEQRLLVDLLAVGDRPVPIQVIARVFPSLRGDLNVLLAVLERKQIVQPAANNREFHLSHDRIRETLYHAIAETSRKELHRKLGGAIEQIFLKDRTPQLGTLAYHFLKAGEHEKAIQYSVAAGDNARDRYANDFAASMYEQALSLLDTSDEKSHEIKKGLADVYRMNGCFEKSQTLLKQLLIEANTDGEKAQLHRRMGNLLFDRSNIADSLNEQWHALELMGERRPRSRFGMMLALSGALLEHLLHFCFPQWIRKSKRQDERALCIEKCGIYAKMGEAYWFCDMHGMILALLRSMNRGEHAGDSKELCFIYCGAQSTYGILTRYRAVKRYGVKAAQMAERIKSDWHRGAVSEASGIASLLMGQWEQALKKLNEARVILAKCGDYLEISIIYMMGYYALLYLGRLQEARNWAAEGVEICRRTGVKGLDYFSAQHALANAYLGQQKRGIQKALEGIQCAEQNSSDLFSLCLTKMAAGECFLETGEIDAAIFHLEHVKMLREEKKLIHDWFVGVYPLLVRARLKKVSDEGRKPNSVEIKELKNLVRTGSRLAQRHPNFLVPSLIAQGMMASVVGKKRLAKNSFSKAIHLAEKQGAMFQSGKAHYEAARESLQYESEVSSNTQAHLTAALNAFSCCEAISWMQSARQLLNKIT